jgi:peptidyl-prolyl cis-trans isomerase SurA
MNRKTPFVKEFKDVAFSLQKVRYLSLSKLILVFILFMLKNQGQEIELRHILLTPSVSEEAQTAARENQFD